MVANWTSIPSDVPSPARALLIQVNGANNDGGTSATNSILLAYGVMVTQRTLTPSFQVRVLVGLPTIFLRLIAATSSSADYLTVKQVTLPSKSQASRYRLMVGRPQDTGEMRVRISLGFIRYQS